MARASSPDGPESAIDASVVPGHARSMRSAFVSSASTRTAARSPHARSAFARVRKRQPHPLLTAEWLDRGEAEYFDLYRGQSEPILLHGDLHHDNVLFDETRGWLAVDPKGVVGELAFETGTALHNPVPHCDLYADKKIMERRVGVFAERLALDPARILRWCFAQALLSAAWHLEDNSGDEEIANMLRAAETAQQLLR